MIQTPLPFASGTPLLSRRSKALLEAWLRGTERGKRLKRVRALNVNLQVSTSAKNR
jgi:hypothetical protein